jgi:hypothetical protein
MPPIRPITLIIRVIPVFIALMISYFGVSSFYSDSCSHILLRFRKCSAEKIQKYRRDRFFWSTKTTFGNIRKEYFRFCTLPLKPFVRAHNSENS